MTEPSWGYLRLIDGWWCTPGWPDAARTRDDVEVYA